MARPDKKPRKVRTEFRKHHEGRARQGDLTRQFRDSNLDDHEAPSSERISGKGDLTRKRTILSHEGGPAGDTPFALQLNVDTARCRPGTVLCSHGLSNDVFGDDGKLYRCATRKLLKSLTTAQRHVLAAGDRVWFRPEGTSDGFIEAVEPRRSVLSRTAKGKQHVIVANIDQLLIVASAAEPVLKPNLIDRFLVTAESIGVRATICINKVDLAHLPDLQPLVGVYARMGYESLLVSARTGFGVERLQALARGAANVVAGQSGVGKSSLLNAIEPGLNLRVSEVSALNEKGKHTTTTGRLVPLAAGGFVIDTPGIRQFQLWNVIPAEVAGFFRDVRPYINRCRFPDCTHQHEASCAVKNAVADGRLDVRRYESYCQIFSGDEP